MYPVMSGSKQNPRFARQAEPLMPYRKRSCFFNIIFLMWILTQIWVRSSGWHWERLQSAGAERRRHHHWSVQRPPTGWEDSDRDLQRAAGDRVCGELRPCLLYWNNHAPPACLVTIPLFQGRTGDFYFNLKSQNYFFNYHFVKISSKSSLFRRRWHTREKENEMNIKFFFLLLWSRSVIHLFTKTR